MCDDSEGGVQVNFVSDDRVEITEKDGLLRFRRVTQDGAASLLYEGPVVALASSERFEAMVSVCAVLQSQRDGAAQTRSGERGWQRLVRCREPVRKRGCAGFEDVQIFGTCKWAYERVSTSDPRVPRC